MKRFNEWYWSVLSENNAAKGIIALSQHVARFNYEGLGKEKTDLIVASNPKWLGKHQYQGYKDLDHGRFIAWLDRTAKKTGFTNIDSYMDSIFKRNKKELLIHPGRTTDMTWEEIDDKYDEWLRSWKMGTSNDPMLMADIRRRQQEY